jgi:hypothetical protein
MEEPMQPGDMRDLDALRTEVSELRAAIGGLRPVPDAASPAPRRFARVRRPAAIVGLIAVLIALPVAVSASHIFTDVPDSNTFHTTISNLYGARITTGCAPGLYCPNDPVTRGSMSAFLNRGLGRAAADANLIDGDDWTTLDGTIASATLRSGGQTGGTASVLVQGTLNAWTDEDNVCPCELEMFLGNSLTSETSVFVYAPVVNEFEPSGYYDGMATISHLFAVPSGTNVTYTMNVIVHTTNDPSPENDAGYSYSLNALYIPFATDGAPVSPFVSTSGLKKSR